MNRDYMDTGLEPEERAKLLLAELSMEEKMAQVNTVFPFDAVRKQCLPAGKNGWSRRNWSGAKKNRQRRSMKKTGLPT
ncbi:MAG: hypothetical protein NC409_08870 [Clostridium sp.]|nr:hypothetical protein [Clostridium sp.]